jgi:intracellular septation protein A
MNIFSSCVESWRFWGMTAIEIFTIVSFLYILTHLHEEKEDEKHE